MSNVQRLSREGVGPSGSKQETKMQNLELVAEYCAKWFKENNVDIPNTAKEWAKSRSGVSMPPGHTYEALRNKGISVGDLLECILPGYVNRVKTQKSL